MILYRAKTNLIYLFRRGEKLYVTKDKRVKSKWRKWLCWAICLALIVGVVIIAILAASKYKKNINRLATKHLTHLIQ